MNIGLKKISDSEKWKETVLLTRLKKTHLKKRELTILLVGKT